MLVARHFVRAHPVWTLFAALVVAWLVVMALFVFAGSGGSGGLHPLGR